MCLYSIELGRKSKSFTTAFASFGFVFVLQDVQMLNSIIDQVCERPMSKSTHLSGFGDDDEDDEGPNYKAIMTEYLTESLKVLCIWDCCTLWLKVSEVLAYLVFDPFTELTITLCIVVNVLFMAADHYSIDYADNGGM